MLPTNDQGGVTPKTGEELLASLSPEVRKVFEETQKGLLSALQREREAHESESKKAAALEKAQQEAERKRLEEVQDYKKLYESTLASVTELKPKAEQVETYEKTLQVILAREIEELPEEFRDIVPDGLSTQQKLDWLSKNKAKLNKPTPFDIGAGKTGIKQAKTTELTPEEKQVARQFGMTEEEYAKAKNL